jgi:hypothetical protein
VFFCALRTSRDSWVLITTVNDKCLSKRCAYRRTSGRKQTIYLFLSFSFVSSFTFFLLSCFDSVNFVSSFWPPFLPSPPFVLVNCLFFPPSYCFSSFECVILLFLFSYLSFI